MAGMLSSIESQLHTWLLIPKMAVAPDAGPDDYMAQFRQFVAEFFRANGIEAKVFSMDEHEDVMPIDGPPVVRVRKFNSGRISFFGGSFDGVVQVDFGQVFGWSSSPAEGFETWLCMAAVDGGDGTSILGRAFSDETNTYKITSVELKGDTLLIDCTYVGRGVVES